MRRAVEVPKPESGRKDGKISQLGGHVWQGGSNAPYGTKNCSLVANFRILFKVKVALFNLLEFESFRVQIEREWTLLLILNNFPIASANLLDT